MNFFWSFYPRSTFSGAYFSAQEAKKLSEAWSELRAIISLPDLLPVRSLHFHQVPWAGPALAHRDRQSAGNRQLLVFFLSQEAQGERDRVV